MIYYLRLFSYFFLNTRMQDLQEEYDIIMSPFYSESVNSYPYVQRRTILYMPPTASHTNMKLFMLVLYSSTVNSLIIFIR
jgi:hypothetical protein